MESMDNVSILLFIFEGFMKDERKALYLFLGWDILFNGSWMYIRRNTSDLILLNRLLRHNCCIVKYFEKILLSRDVSEISRSHCRSVPSDKIPESAPNPTSASLNPLVAQIPSGPPDPEVIHRITPPPHLLSHPNLRLSSNNCNISADGCFIRDYQEDLLHISKHRQSSQSQHLAAICQFSAESSKESGKREMSESATTAAECSGFTCFSMMLLRIV